MLVLSRRVHEKILLPTINTTVQVVAVKPGVVRLGISAPPDVVVLREELHDRAVEWDQQPPAAGPAPSAARPDQLARQVSERLQATAVALGLARLQLDLGLAADARESLVRLQEGVQLLLHGVNGESEPFPPPPPARPARRALLVEDDHNERELLAGLLRLSGFEVATAGDGCDALDYLHTHDRPDVVLCDMVLPRCDGPTVVRELRRDPAYAGLKIFGVTGHLPEEFGLAGGPAGIDRWFCKPLDPAALIRDLSQELDQSSCPV